MHITKMKLEDLNPAKYNPRVDLQPGDEQYENIKNSIKQFGYIDPIIVNIKNNNNIIVGGHQRYKVLKDLGYDEVDVVQVDMEEDEEKACNITLNQATGDWDQEKLDELLLELKDTEFNMKDFGFEELEKELEKNKKVIEDEAPEPAKEAVSKYGQIYKLGRHRLMCGDSVNKDDVEKLMNGNKADMVFTDPPYGVSYSNNMNDKFEVIKNDDKILDILPILTEFSKDNIHWYIWTSHQVYPIWRDMFNKYYKHSIIWYKHGGGIGDLSGNYATDYEMCLFCHFGRKKLIGNREGAVWELNKDNGADYVHPTQKPVQLSIKALNHSSLENENVLDLFGGSGSTLIGCEQLNRNCYMMELDPAYIDVIIERWENFTGKKAELLSE